ncbi:dephospho-CoA kinase [Chryseosolibacter indicus]|uniref:dephospho-CoA kinase n=1 Tax=Chryseosolibacter indicus TaxID=2782351 RepID=UPI0020B18704
MAKPFQIGITGGIGSGKSTVCKIFQHLGVPVYDADSHAKKLMTTDGILISQIKKEFGDLSYNSDGTLNRIYLGNNVFHNEEKLALLNSLVHPRVAIDYSHWVNENKQHTYVIKEAALLFEANSHKGLDRVIVVTAPEALRFKRVLARDLHRTVEQLKAIVEKQMPEDEKRERADHIIVNDESMLVIPQVLELHALFSSL